MILPTNHRLAALKAISPKDLVGERFVIGSQTAPVLCRVIDNYFKRSRVKIAPAHEADHVTMGISLIMSTRGVGLLPVYAQNFLPSSVTSRPLIRRLANCRSGLRLQKVERVSHPEAFAFEIGRVGRSCLEEDPLKLGVPAMSSAAGEDALRYS